MERILVQDLMTKDVLTCHPDTTLRDAAETMLHRDCGILPVIDEERCLQGMITDRDICMCAMIEGVPLDQVAVSRAMSKEVIGLRPTDTFEEICAAMRDHHVRRLPVMSEDHELLGIVGLGDLALAVTEKRKGAVPGGLVQALAGVTSPAPEPAST